MMDLTMVLLSGILGLLILILIRLLLLCVEDVKVSKGDAQ